MDPLSSELFNIEQLKRHATTLATHHKIDSRPKSDKLLSRLLDNEIILLAAYDLITEAAIKGNKIILAEAWLLDNFYLIEQQVEQIRRYLPREYSYQLPRLLEGVSAGFPRVYDLALQLISHMDGRVDKDNVIHFIAAYQTVIPLKLGELWAFPIMLQLALLENVRRVALRIARRREESDLAVIWRDRIATTIENEPKKLIQLLAEFTEMDLPLSASMVEEFSIHFQSQGPTMMLLQSWVEQKLLDQEVTAAQLLERSTRAVAANQISITNCINSFRFINAMDWREYVELLSVVEETLRKDPAHTHETQDFATRDNYRHAVEEIARRSSQSELQVAQTAIDLAQSAAEQLGIHHRSAHVGYYLIDQGRPALEHTVNSPPSWKSQLNRIGQSFNLFLYLVPILLITIGATYTLLDLLNINWNEGWHYWFFALTGFIATSALAISLVNFFVTLFHPPRILPRMDFSRGIPAYHRTMVVVPTLLIDSQQFDNLLADLEIRYLGNKDPNLFFALLTDFQDAQEPLLPDESALLVYANEAITKLNATYSDDRPCIFYLFHRPRKWNPHEQIWMGYERKRGKLEQFNALLRGIGKDAFSEIVGNIDFLETIRYVITLDTDTQLPHDTAQALVGNMAHPLNRPVYDSNRKRVVAGYAILQPRVSISMSSANQSRFTQLFAGETGIDPYSREVSDVYQDIFAEGSFVGKGIYDVDAFRQTIDGRFPENLILSHDLLEGGYARSALVTDVNLIEEHPASYTQESSRRHRWIRGDWQLVNWLLPSVPLPVDINVDVDVEKISPKRQRNPLSALSIWKIFDNLRRSLVPPSLLALLIGSLLFSSSAPWFWIVLIASIWLLPILAQSLAAFLRKPPGCDWWIHTNLSIQQAARPIALALLTVIMLPYDAMINLNAILHSGIRMLYTKRKLLLWYLPSYNSRNACYTLSDFLKEMWIGPVLASTLSVLLWDQSLDFLFYSPVLLAWFLSPFIAWWISQPLSTQVPHLNDEQRMFLRMAARRTWRYFAQFVSAEDNWLPPDNFQEYPAKEIASRTSPTNMGMSLLAHLSAHDFGYLSTGQLLQRIEDTLTTMEKLECYLGHFYNWYDTRTLTPLPPKYISSVDSGNLVGSLLTLQAGLMELKDQPILGVPALRGLQDTLNVLAEIVTTSFPASEIAKKINKIANELTEWQEGEVQYSTAEIARFLNKLHYESNELIALLPKDIARDHDLYNWIQMLEDQTNAFRHDLNELLFAPKAVNKLLTLEQLANDNPSDMDPALLAKIHKKAEERINRIDGLIERCRKLAIMDFDFLYDTSRDLLAIGYDVGERRHDQSYYDLLASEARLASFLLIAQRKIPQKHWFTLGRLLTSHGSGISLISWSGSMFEYLMPCLIMPNYPDTLLGQTCKAAVSRQIEYGRQRAVPWGISESCYNLTDKHHIYQYRAFGVPGLGFKRGLSDDLVIAPYASALALMIMPQEACHNLQKMAASGFLGAYGFYEAIDYTRTRVPRGKTHAVVRNFMAHHQGMSLLAFEYVLLDQPMQRRFMSDPQIQAAELFLHERIPRQSITLHPHAAEVSAAARSTMPDTSSLLRIFTDPNTPIPEVHLLSNGQYHVMATHAGGGYSRWQNIAITRWREDVTADNWGTFIYLRDSDSGEYWSSAYQPTLREADYYEAIFVQARAEYRRRDHSIETHTEITVSPEHNVEIRRITITNQSSYTRYIEVTSYAEVVLTPLNSDLAHRAFSNLFVQTEIISEKQAILCTRRPRMPGEQVPWMFHLLTAPSESADEPTYETDRAQFIGRGRTPANPIVLEKNLGNSVLSNSAGSILDPIMAIRRMVTLLPNQSTVIQVISGVGGTREEALMLVDNYSERHFIERAFEMAWFQNQEVLRHLSASEADAQIFASFASSIIYNSAFRRTSSDIIARNQLGQSGLWRFSISGDLPIILVRIANLNRIDLVKLALQAHAYWRIKGLIADLVIMNEDFSGYRAVLHDYIVGLINASSNVSIIDKPGGIFFCRTEELSEDERILLQTVARVILSDTTETLIQLAERRISNKRVSDLLNPQLLPVHESQNLSFMTRERIFYNGVGGFTPDGREYIITLEPGQNTPMPWVNVIASPHIGTVISECGGAYTWVENAHEFRLTTWHNDPISDSSGEALYIRDEETGEFWSPAPLPARGQFGYVCRHGFGYSVFEYAQSNIFSEAYIYVAMDAPAKFIVIKLRNHSSRKRKLSLTSFWELVLGEWRHSNLMHIVTETDLQSGALFARNTYSREYAKRIVFACVNKQNRFVTGNRTEFIGRNGSLNNPAAMRRKTLSGKTGAGFDPCAAIQTMVELESGEEQEIVFLLGAAHSAEEARQLIQQYGQPIGAHQALEAVWGYWNHTLGAVHVETPDTGLNVLVNGWLIYQTLSCRFWGRSGYYQSGGAYGFRDQLQDSMALIYAAPWLAREQLLRCAGRQFLQGDVQHWWHPPNGQGVRTHFSDDYLWLPYATCHYVLRTGDTGVLDEEIHFLEGRELHDEEESYYDHPQYSSEVASLYEHCVRAIQHALRFGEHNLPLIGCGDWNDGMNLIGRHGKGESVWLGWFLYQNLELFSSLARDRGDVVFADLCIQQADKLRENIETYAWDGNWYRRAFFDDGTPLGSADNDECKIDSISQSWAVISTGGEPTRARQAMIAVDSHLVHRDSKLIQLLTPPFDKSSLEPGYIKGYVPGIRENGGQYTHAAIWATMAFALLDDRNRAWELLAMLNPINHSLTPVESEHYKVEPYVMCADIYGATPHTGRGGWTWYTGAAGWMYRLIVETLLGLQLNKDSLCITTRVPPSWETYTIHYRFFETFYHITITQKNEVPHQMSTLLDGVLIEEIDTSKSEQTSATVPLVNDKRDHLVEIKWN